MKPFLGHWCAGLEFVTKPLRNVLQSALMEAKHRPVVLVEAGWYY